MELKNRIISESLKLFSLKGFLSTSLDDILKASGSSKGGFYNHFKSKEELFYAVLIQAQKTWREKALYGLNNTSKPVERIKLLLNNYRDRYLVDTENFPGGCVFVSLSVELDDLRPHLAQEINKGFVRFKAMIKKLLDESKDAGELAEDVSTKAVSEMLFSGMLGASVMYGMDKSKANLDQTIQSLIRYLEGISV